LLSGELIQYSYAKTGKTRLTTLASTVGHACLGTKLLIPWAKSFIREPSTNANLMMPLVARVPLSLMCAFDVCILHFPFACTSWQLNR